jgi:DNA topoisomerase-1
LSTGLHCPECGKSIHIEVGKNGHFLACTGYPDCNYSRNYTRDEKGTIRPEEPSVEKTTNVNCEKCGKPMVKKYGRFGEFLACSGYPDCMNTRSLNSSGPGKSTGVMCPEKGCGGELVERRSKRGKIFYGCNRFPSCNFATWDKPINKKCPICGAQFVVEKTTKREGTFLTCHSKECDFKEPN